MHQNVGPDSLDSHHTSWDFNVLPCSSSIYGTIIYLFIKPKSKSPCKWCVHLSAEVSCNTPPNHVKVFVSPVHPDIWKSIALKESRLRPLLLLIKVVFRCRCVWNVGGMKLTEQMRYRETNLSQCPWSAIIVTLIGPFSNPRLRSNRPITNPLSHCTDVQPKLMWTIFKIYFVLHSENTSFFKHRPIS